MWSELRVTLRQASRKPLASAAIVGILGLGVGACLATWTLIDQVLLHPLPFPEADRLVEVWDRWEDTEAGLLTAPEIFALRAQSKSLSSVGAFVTDPTTHTTAEGSKRLRLLALSTEMFDLLGVEPLLGRRFTFAEDKTGAKDVALVSWELWQERLGGADTVLGETLLLEETPYEVIGVLPKDSTLPRNLLGDPRADVWIPLRLEPAFNVHYFSVLARLSPSSSLESAQAEIDALRGEITAQARPGSPAALPSFRMAIVPVQEQLLGRARPALTLLFLAALALTLVVAANVAALRFSQLREIQHESAVRLALGAERSDLARAALLGPVVHCLLAIGPALVVAWGIVAIVARLNLGSVPRLVGGTAWAE